MKIHEPTAEYLVDKKGRKKAVLLSVEQYDRLLEDLHDLKVAAERKSEKPVPLSQVKSRLKKHGRL